MVKLMMGHHHVGQGEFQDDEANMWPLPWEP